MSTNFESIPAASRRSRKTVDSGFGFITPDAGGNDLFAHFSEIQGSDFKSLHESQKVRYVAGAGQKGPAADLIFEPVEESSALRSFFAGRAVFLPR